jgi:Zn-dependent peptidase ImmA (M78 family)
VLAHEIGHFILHSNNNFPDSNLTQYNKLDTMRTLALYKFDKDNPHTWREWQANRFASCILVSRFTIRDELIRLQKLLGINRGLGKIYLDHQGINKRDFHTLTSHLSRIYSVSRTVVKLRLKALDLLTETTFAKTSDILLDVLENLNIQG